MIDLSLEIKKDIVNSLVVSDPESRQLFLKSINNETGVGTQNSKHKQKWDYRYNTIIKVAEKHGLEYLKISRGGLWEAITILGNNDELYVFFSEKNIKTILRQGKSTHYLLLLNLFNEELDNLPPIQGHLPILEDDESEVGNRKVLAREMIDVLEKDPKKIVVFSFNSGLMPTVKAHTFNTKQQLVWKADLTYLIESDYRFVLEDDNIKPASRESDIKRAVKTEKKRIVKLKS